MSILRCRFISKSVLSNLLLLLTVLNQSGAEYCSLCANPYHVPRNEQGYLAYLDSRGQFKISTCAEAYLNAQRGEFSNCNDLHFMSREYCDCGPINSSPTPAPSVSKCTLCSDGSAISSPALYVAGLTCQQWELKANQVTDDSCYTYQSSLALHCGCPEPDWTQSRFREYCRFCPFPGKRVKSDTFISTNQGPRYCVQLEQDINLSPFQRCEFEQMIYGSYCGCEDITPSPISTCTLCSNGSSLLYPYQLVAGKTCLEWEEEAQGRPDHECTSYQGSYGIACGCAAPNFSEPPFESYCKLCANGYVNPEKFFYTENGILPCLTLEQRINIDNQDRCAFEQNLYGSICGCPSPPTPPPPSPTPRPPTRPAPCSKGKHSCKRQLTGENYYDVTYDDIKEKREEKKKRRRVQNPSLE